MKNFIDNIYTAFDNNSKHFKIENILSDIQILFRISEKADLLFSDQHTSFTKAFEDILRYQVNCHRESIELYVKQKISEVSDQETK